MNKFERICKELKKKHNLPESQWRLWRKRPKTKKEKEEVAIGAILTQRTNWKNVELALRNLKEAKVLSINKIYRLGKESPRVLKKLIRPSGFYKQKAKRLFYFCEFIVKNYGTLENFFKQNLETCRQELLKIYGVGPETADSILLYAGQKLVFVIDEYTRRFAKKRGISRNLSLFRASRRAGSYDYLQGLFQKNLPQDIKIYQDFHAMIVLEGKGSFNL